MPRFDEVRKRFRQNMKLFVVPVPVHMMVPVVIWLALCVYDACFLFGVDTGRTKAMEHIQDVRVMNQYTSYYLGFISLVIGLLARPMIESNDAHKMQAFWLVPFGVAVVAAAATTMFIPVTYKDDAIWASKVRWLYGACCHQCAAIFTAYGLVLLIIDIRRKINNDKAMHE